MWLDFCRFVCSSCISTMSLSERILHSKCRGSVQKKLISPFFSRITSTGERGEDEEFQDSGSHLHFSGSLRGRRGSFKVIITVIVCLCYKNMGWVVGTWWCPSCSLKIQSSILCLSLSLSLCLSLSLHPNPHPRINPCVYGMQLLLLPNSCCRIHSLLPPLSRRPSPSS